MEYLNQPGGSVGEVTRLEAIAAQMNVPIDTVAYLNFGDAIGTARFLFDPILQRTWLVPFSVPCDTVMETMINDQLNGKYTLTPCDLLVTHFHYSWQKHMAQGVWIRTKTDLVWCLEDGVWYRWVGDESKFPFITTNITSPRKSNDVVTPANPLGNWEDMGITGLGATYKGDRGEQGKSNYDLWLEAGNKGTFEDYQKTLIGPQGIQGIQGKDGKTGPQGIAGTEITNIVGISKEIKDLPCPPTPPSYEDNPNALFIVDFSIAEETLIPGIPVKGTIKITDAATGKPVDLKADTLRVNISNGLGSTTVPVKTVGKTGEYTTNLTGMNGSGITFSVFISDIYMHESSRYLKILQLENAYRFTVYATPNLIEVNGNPTEITLEVTDYLTRELADIPLSTVGLVITSGEGTLSEFTKVSTGKYSAKLTDHGVEGAIYLTATVNDVKMQSSTIVVNVVPEFQGKFWEAKMHANTKGYIGINSWAFGGYGGSVKPADCVVYINGTRAVYKETLGTSNDTTWYFTTPNTSITELNQVQITGSFLVYWTNNIAEITRIGSGVTRIDCGGWSTTSGGLIPRFSCPLPKSVDNLDYAFQNCRLETIEGIEEWDTSHVTSFVGTFAGLASTSVTLSYDSPRRNKGSTIIQSSLTQKLPWDLTNAKNINYIFAANGSINVDISTLPKLETAIYIFVDSHTVSFKETLVWENCTNIAGMCANVDGVIDLNIDNSVLPNVTNLNFMFTSLTYASNTATRNVTASLKNINFKNVTTADSFISNRGIQSLDISGTTFGNITNTSRMFGVPTTSNNVYSITMVNTEFSNTLNASEMFMYFKNILPADVVGLSFPKLQIASNMFASCSSINFSDLSKIITENLINASGMFYGCSALDTKLNTCNVSGLIDATSMFSLCFSLNQDLTGMDFKSLTTAKSMFVRCESFNGKINANFPKLTEVTEMFSGCLQFNQDIAPLFKSGTVKQASSTFKSCRVLNYSLENCDFSNLVGAASMLYGCANFNQDIQSKEFPSLINATSMFEECSSFNQNISALKMPLLTNASRMFYGCTSLTVGLKDFTLPSMTIADSMFADCPAINKDCTNMYLPETTDITSMFSFSTSNREPRVLDFTGSRFPKVRKVLSLFTGATLLNINFTNVLFGALNAGTDLFTGVDKSSATVTMRGAKFPALTVADNMFQGFRTLDDSFEEVDFSALVSANNMFAGCTIFNPSFTNAKFGSLISAISMFSNCTKFNTDISGLFSPTLVNASNMLSGCSSFNRTLKGNWLELTNATNMLQNCTSYNSSLSEVIFNKLTDASRMFAGCTSFNQSIPSTVFPQLVNAAGMLSGCSSFNESVLINFTKVTSTKDMFKDCASFNQPLNFNLIGVLDASSMFNGCSVLDQPFTNLELPVCLNITMMFANCYLLNQPLDALKAPNALNATSLFQACRLLNQKVSALSLPKLTVAASMFKYCRSLNSEVDLTLDNVNDMSDMFADCIGMTDKAIKISSQSCRAVTRMFSWCTNLNAEVTLTMPNLGSIASLFENCTSFNGVVVVESSNISSTEKMFRNCSSFNQPLNNLNVSKVTYFTSMFEDAYAFNQPLNLWVTTSAASSTSSVTTSSMSDMFNGARNFVQDISMWKVPQISNTPLRFDTGTSSNWTSAMKPKWGK